MKPSIEETIVDWLGEHSLQVSSIEVETAVHVTEDGCEETKVLYKAEGSFYPCGLDPQDDELCLEYHQFTRTDERFRGTKMEFIGETKFKIV